MAIGAVALFGGYVIDSFGTIAPALKSLSPMSFFSWTAGHRPLAGVTDWPSVGLLAVVTVVLLVVGVVGFERRDLGSATALRWLRAPCLPGGVGGPFRRQLADRTAIAIAGGAGIGIYAALIALGRARLPQDPQADPGHPRLSSRSTRRSTSSSHPGSCSWPSSASAR